MNRVHTKYIDGRIPEVGFMPRTLDGVNLRTGSRYCSWDCWSRFKSW